MRKHDEVVERLQEILAEIKDAVSSSAIAYVDAWEIKDLAGELDEKQQELWRLEAGDDE